MWVPLWPHVNERNPVSRAFQGASTATEQGLNLALAPALTPGGYTENPSFFSGFTTQPQVVARALNALAEITSTRYYNFTPDSQRDPSCLPTVTGCVQNASLPATAFTLVLSYSKLG